MKHDTDPTATRLGFGSVVDPAAPEPTPEPDPSATRLGFVLSEDPGHRPPEPRPPRRAPSEPRVIVVPEPAARGSGATHDTAGGEAFTAETLLPPDAAPGAPTGLFHQVDLALRDPDLCDTTLGLEPIHRRKAVQVGVVILGLGLLCVLAWTLAATDEAPMRIEQGATRAPGKKPEKQAPARVRPAVPPAPVVAPPGTPPRPTASATRPTASATRPTASATRPTASATRPTASATRPTARATRPRIRTRRRRARPRHRRARPRLKVRYDRRANLVEITLPRESANARVVVKRGGEPTTR